MIHVERTQPGPAVLSAADGAGLAEPAEALAFFAVAANANASYDKFKVYKDDSVKTALYAMFHGKCAYCEFMYIGGMPVDIEHFRPKGAVIVDGKMRKPGYYWLAAKWENLLPSCIDCNRKREQELQDGTSGQAGKANHFPVRDEKKRATKPGDERKEKTLLLDPCVDEPAEHLEFRNDGWVVPRVKSGKASPAGAASIEVFGLARVGLVQMRAAQAKIIEKDLERLRRQLRLIEKYPDDPDIQTELLEVRNSLRTARAPQTPYSAMARQIIQPALRALGIQLE
ncbi:MAG: hypothetical protein ACXW5U_14130 [Thermoanaerobaculia bacterium]